MKPIRLATLLTSLLLLTLSGAAYAESQDGAGSLKPDDIKIMVNAGLKPDAIVDAIKQSKSAYSAADISAVQKAVPNISPDVIACMKQMGAKKKESEDKKVSKKSEEDDSAPSHSSKRAPLFHPADKLPRDVAGLRVSGRFITKFLESDGVVLVGAQDLNNPFARQFIVANIDTGVTPGQAVPANPRLITVTDSKPLRLISRGLIPGTYLCTATNPAPITGNE